MSRDSTRVARVWDALVGAVMDGRDEWRREIASATGLPFSRVRALRRLAGRPLTLRELAEAIGSDAPAATVIVNDLEGRGLVQRREHPSDRRAKIVSLTNDGKRTLARARQVRERVPPWMSALSDADIAALARMLEPLTKRR